MVGLSGPRLASLLDEWIEAEFAHQGCTGLAVTVVREDWSHVKVAGERRSGSGDPVTPRTAFDVGSCSKSYLATAVACLVGQGALGFDDPIGNYVPELEFADPWVAATCTIRDLLSNRSGLGEQPPCGFLPRGDIPGTDLLRRNRFIRPACGFRERFAYANLGFHAVAHAVERASGRPYAECLEREVFEPLGMHQTASGTRVRERLGERAVGHTKQREPLELPDMLTDNMQGQACVFSCGADAVPWLRLHLDCGEVGDRRLLPASALAETHRPHAPLAAPPENIGFGSPLARFASYCMGWAESDFRGMRLVAHSGATAGWRAVVAFIPEARVGVAVYISSTHTSATSFSYPILELLLEGEPGPDWRALHERNVTRIRAEQVRGMEHGFACEPGDSGLASDRLEGRYTSAASGGLEITRLGEDLHMHLVDGPIYDARLVRLGGDVFELHFDEPAFPDFFAPLHMRLRFERDGDRAAGISTAYWGAFERAES